MNFDTRGSPKRHRERRERRMEAKEIQSLEPPFRNDVQRMQY
jgi:hypothetical protein